MARRSQIGEIDYQRVSARISATDQGTRRAAASTAGSEDVVECSTVGEGCRYLSLCFKPQAARSALHGLPDGGWTWYYSGNFRIVTDDSPFDGLKRQSEGIYVQLEPRAASSTCEEVPELASVEPSMSSPIGSSSVQGWTSPAGGP